MHVQRSVNSNDIAGTQKPAQLPVEAKKKEKEKEEKNCLRSGIALALNVPRLRRLHMAVE